MRRHIRLRLLLVCTQERNGSIGIDLGIKNQLTLSNGIRINYEVLLSKQMKRLCRRLSKKRYHSRNWRKAKTRLEKSYNNTTSIKRDIQNKLVCKLTEQFGTICFQNDAIKSLAANMGKANLEHFTRWNNQCATKKGTDTKEGK